MTTNPSPGGSQEPPSFSQVEVDDFCRRLEPTLEPHEIGPAEVHTLGAPMQDEYVTVSRRIWHETSARCLDNELRAARLQQQVDDLQVQLEARVVVRYRKDEEYAGLERRNRSLTRALWAAASMLVVVMLVVVVWRVM